MRRAVGAFSLVAALTALGLASVAIGSGQGVHDLAYGTVVDALVNPDRVDGELVKLVGNRVTRTVLGSPAAATTSS